MLTALVAAVVVVIAPPHGAKLDGHWNLGHGYKALRYMRVPHPPERGGDRWTFEIVRGGHLVRRWRVVNQAMQVDLRDVTGDGIKDVLVTNYIGGSGGWAGYRLYAGPHLKPLWRLRGVSGDMARVHLLAHGIADWTAIDGSHHTTSIHCCWRRWTHREWRWKNGRLRLVQRTVTTQPPLS
jgi:hypothetical protein